MENKADNRIDDRDDIRGESCELADFLIQQDPDLLEMYGSRDEIIEMVDATIDGDKIVLSDIKLGVELEEYLRDLVEYGLGRYEIDFGGEDTDELFHLWGQYKKEQVMQLLLRNPGDIMKGTKILDGVTYAYVTVIKGKAIKDNLNYDDGYARITDV